MRGPVDEALEKLAAYRDELAAASVRTREQIEAASYNNLGDAARTLRGVLSCLERLPRDDGEA